LTSLIGIVSFGMWEMDMEEVPVLYNFGSFLALYWFHDKLKPGKAHFGSFAADGPPLVAVSGMGKARPWPYNATTGFTSSGLHYTDNDGTVTVKDASKYTPVDGLYGVSAQKENSRDKRVEYYPQAQQPNDYIAKVFLGPHASWTDLYQMSDPLKVYNKNNFPGTDPFIAAKIGTNQPNDKRWQEASRYEVGGSGTEHLMVPLTSAGTTIPAPASFPYVVNPFYPVLQEYVRDYSGAEYQGTDPSYPNSLEMAYCKQGLKTRTRPPWYEQDTIGNVLTGQNDMAAFPGEDRGDPGYDPYNEFGLMSTYPTYYTPMDQPGIATGWGSTASKDTTKYWDGLSPDQIQRDYIVSQLSRTEPGPFTEISK
jgi:hypothetical protein